MILLSTQLDKSHDGHMIKTSRSKPAQGSGLPLAFGEPPDTGKLEIRMIVAHDCSYNRPQSQCVLVSPSEQFRSTLQLCRVEQAIDLQIFQEYTD